MDPMSEKVANYVEVVESVILRGAVFIQFDKSWLKEDFGTLTAGLEFVHNVLRKLAVKRKLKFTIDTTSAADRFDVNWEEVSQ
jgi:hypothetical protein